MTRENDMLSRASPNSEISRLQKKLRPDLGEGPAAREPSLGTGRGGDVTGSANSFLSARRNRGGRGAWFTKRDPHVRIGLRLSLHEAVAGLGPGQDLRLLIVENEFTAIGFDREHGVTVALLVAYDGDEQGLARPASLHEHATLEPHIVFAVTVAVVRFMPALDRAPMHSVGHRLNRLVLLGIDWQHGVPRPGGEDHVPRHGGPGLSRF